MSDRILIIGAGPCGLGCARQLVAAGHDNWLLLEQADHAGGLASSVVDPQGFTWDHGGHVVFSHFGEFDRLLDEVMGDDVYEHERSSYIRIAGTWVPYPFQNNLHQLPPDLAEECLAGLIEAPGCAPPDADFGSWMAAMFGPGITRLFMGPYNRKVWATPPELMSASWIAERVSVVDWRAALHALVHRSDDVAWGPNNTFVFPTTGGTGEIYRRLAERLADRIRYGTSVVTIDPETRTVTCADGTVEPYDQLVSTMPLDLLIGSLTIAPDALRSAAVELEHNTVYMVGVGYETPLVDDRSWLYFPEPDVPFYRVTNFAKYSPDNVPGGSTDRYTSFMTEVSTSRHNPIDLATLETDVEAGLRSVGLVEGRPEIASIHVEKIPYGYPVPTRGRDAALATIQPWLAERGIRSRGRFGAWRYEIANMDHSVKMGIDAADAALTGAPEELWTT